MQRHDRSEPRLNKRKGGDSKLVLTTSYEIPEEGERKTAIISKIEEKKSKEVFTNSKGEYKGKFSNPDDPVFVVYGNLKGENKELKLGTVNAPNSRKVWPNSNFGKLCRSVGLKGRINIKDFKGKEVPVQLDARGFPRLAL